jgi:Domain of unknown function (DUF4129)
VGRRRLVPLALVVTLLLAVVAVVARGRPLGKSSGSGGGLPLTFWDYAFTSFVIFVLLLFLLGLSAFFFMSRDRDQRPARKRGTVRSLVGLVVISAFIAFVARHLDLNRLHPHSTATSTTATSPGTGQKGKNGRPLPPQHVQFRWDELAVILAVLAVLGVFAVRSRAKLGPPTDRSGATKALAEALDESLDDLRTDPDLRRAIIAAYARMERALAAAGLPRHHAEAPLEYLERVLLELDTSATAVRRLTDLFLWARFSHHEPEPAMRDEAIDALVAVRDELRASELTPA